jgi:putative ABC transport system permease protein
MKEILSFILKNIKRRKLRSWLTIIGIIVGVFAIVSLMSLSQSLQDRISSNFDQLGARKIEITSKYNLYGSSSSSQALRNNDIDVLKKISDIEKVIGSITASVSIEYNKINKYFTLIGYNSDDIEDMFYQNNLKLLKGKYLSSDKSREIIIGYDFFENYKDVFEKKLDVGDYLKIENSSYKIVGILDDTGGRGNTNIYLSLDNVRDITLTDSETVDVIYAIIKENKNLEDVSKRINNKLESYRGSEDFTITTPQKTAQQRKDILNIVSIVVIGIAAISLLVGGIGILNSMYTSVVERKKEIGVMKAIGAKRTDILTLFLLESGIIGLIGGIIGSFVGFLVAFLISFVANIFNVDIGFSLNLNILLIALGFSFVVGIVSGFWPAYKASQQEPVECLREE